MNLKKIIGSILEGWTLASPVVANRTIVGVGDERALPQSPIIRFVGVGDERATQASPLVFIIRPRPYGFASSPFSNPCLCLLVQLFSLPFAKIGDLLHDLSASRHPIHRRAYSWEERHERSHKPTRAAHDDDLRLITPEALQDRLSHGLWWRHEGFAHSGHGYVHLLHRARAGSCVFNGAEDEDGTADSCLR